MIRFSRYLRCRSWLWLWIGLSAIVAIGHPGDGLSDTRATRDNTDKINTNLLRLDHALQAGSNLFEAARQYSITTQDTGIQLRLITTRPGSEVLPKLGLPGVTVLHASEHYHRVSVRITDTSVLYTLAQLSEVVMIDPLYGSAGNAGSVPSRADIALNTVAARGQFKVNGAGQVVGILSDSFARTDFVRDANTLPPPGVPGALMGSQPQDSGDLPPVVTLRRDIRAGADEGAGLAELIHDLAPGAAIVFHTVGDSDAEFAAGIRDLCGAAGATVVVDDWLFFAEPMYQDGIIAQAAADCVARGIPYFSAAGNWINKGFRRIYADIAAADEALMSPNGMPASPTGIDLHDWGSGDGFLDITIPPRATLTVILQWNQPFQSLSPLTGAQIDFNLYMTRTPDAAGLANPIFESSNVQGVTNAPRGDAIEFIHIQNFMEAPSTVYLAVDHFQGNENTIPQDNATPVEFRLVFFEFGGRSTIQGIPHGGSEVGGPTMYGHSVAAGVISVAAVPWYDTTRFNSAFPPTAFTDAEFFTSKGGDLGILFNPDGQIAPRQFFEPDIAAVDGNNTTFFQPGFNLDDLVGYQGEPDAHPNFFGTSAAVANAAAVGALIRELDGTLTPAEIQTVLSTTAIDIRGLRTTVGPDDVTGSGLINAPAALRAAQSVGNQPPQVAIDSPSTDVVIVRGSPVIFAATGTDPDGHLPLTFAWSFDGGAPNANVEDPGAVIFNTVGNFRVRLTATDQRNLTSPVPASRIVTVTATPNQPPNADISSPLTAPTIVQGESVNFTATATDPDGDLPLTYNWNFAGGAPNVNAKDPGPVKFATAGTYIVQLGVTDQRGAADPTPATRLVIVNPPTSDPISSDPNDPPSSE